MFTFIVPHWFYCLPCRANHSSQLELRCLQRQREARNERQGPHPPQLPHLLREANDPYPARLRSRRDGPRLSLASFPPGPLEEPSKWAGVFLGASHLLPARSDREWQGDWYHHVSLRRLPVHGTTTWRAKLGLFPPSGALEEWRLGYGPVPLADGRKTYA